MMLLWAFLISNFLASCFGGTNFCMEPLGMKRRIILDGQITESSIFYNMSTRRGFNARLDNNHCWCSYTGSTLLQQWVKVDLRYPMSIRGISIQGDPGHLPNYIKKFKFRYSVDGTNYLYKKDNLGDDKEFTGATGQNQKIDKMFDTKPFAARYVEFRPTDFAGNDACVRFELYGCAYVCNEGLGVESGKTLPSGFVLTSSSNQSGKAASSARLSDASSSWCASTNDQNQYLQIDFGKVMTMTGIAIQGNPTANSWVKDFYFDYGMALDSLVTYQEYGTRKLFVGNVDRDTKVVNWFKGRLFARYIRIKPNSWNGDICIRTEVIGCYTDSIYEIGAENKVLENTRFKASGFTSWVSGRYEAHDGRLNNDKPWGISQGTSINPWFKVDLGRMMLVNGISTQGDGVWGPNYYPDFKIQYSFDVITISGNLTTIKQDFSLSERVFQGNTNNAGVKFNLIEYPISMRHVQFVKHTNPLHDYTLRVEIYGKPQTCTATFGMEAGLKSTYNPTVSVSSGMIPVDKAKLNTATAWCASTDDVNQYFQYDFGDIRTISGFAIQGHPADLKWVKTFKVDYKEVQSQSFTTYQQGGSDKTFVGCKSRNLIVYHWFSSNLRMRYLRIKPLTWSTNICLRMNAYGCPKTDCFSEIGIQSSRTISNYSMTSSSQVIGNEAHNGRLNMESVWEACQFGSCSPKEANGNKPWIQVCFPSVKRVSSIIVQGPGNFDSIASVTEFSLKFSSNSSGSFKTYINDGALKKYEVSSGRYTSSQIDLPFSIVSKCIRLQVESQTPTNQNAGLRWGLLGCNSVPQPSSVTITLSSPTSVKNSDVTLTCTVNALPGVGLSWKKGSTVLSTSGVHEVGAATPSNDNVKYEVSMTLKVTATTAYVITSFASCVVTNSVSGSAECKQSYECAASYDNLTSSAKSELKEVTVTGLHAKPTAPTGIINSSLTNTSLSVTWNAPACDFPIKDYRAVIKTKSNNNAVETKTSLVSTSATFSSLNPFTEYIVEISAQSSLNVFSNAATLEVKTDEGVSTAPINLKAIAVSATSIVLTWDPPTLPCGILHDYRVWSNAGHSINAGKQLTSIIQGLKQFTVYRFKVQATTKGGLLFGNWSSIVASQTQEGAASAPTNVSAVILSATVVQLTWEPPTSPNGILHDYRIRYKLASNSSYGASIIIGKKLTVTVSELREYSDYEFQVQASTKGGSIAGEWSSVLKIKTSIDVIPKPSLQVIQSNDGSTKISLEKVPSNFDIIKQYRLSIVQGNASECPRASLSEIIDASKLPLIIEFKPGVKEIKGMSLEMGSIGNHSLCYRAILQDKIQVRMSHFVTLTIERKSLEKLDPVLYPSEESSFVIPMAKGPANTKNYHVIVMEGNTSSKNPNEWQPSELGPYDASAYKTGKPYITAVLSSYVSKFSVGDGKKYSLSNRKRRNVGSVTYENVPLKANTEYLIFQRAYVSQTVYYSSPWLGPVKTIVKKSSQAGSEAGKEGLSTAIIIAFAILSSIVIILLAVIIYIVRMRKPRESVHKDRKNDSLPMEDLKQPQISINNSGFDNLDHSLQHAAEYEEMHGSQAEDVYETINNATCNEQRYQTLDKYDGTATYQNIAS